MSGRIYQVVRFAKSGRRRIMERNLTREEAKRYCNRDDTKGHHWFCGFEVMPGRTEAGA